LKGARKIFSISILGFGIFFQAENALADDCKAAVEQFQRPPGVAEAVSVNGQMLNCSLVDYGVALRADFQPRITGAPTDKVTQVKLDHPGFPDDGSPIYAKALEEYYGARGMNLLATCGQVAGGKCVASPDGEQGISLFAKLSTAIQSEYPNDPDLLQYIQGDLTANSLPLPATGPGAIRADTGSCLIWSAWSMDPEVKAMLAKVGDGIFCGGIPFTQGELKELITTTYPDPMANIETKSLDTTTYNNGANETIKEQANLVLAKLGAFGNNGDFTPGQLVAKAADSKSKGDRLIMDLDPGNNQIWNQPIEAILDVEYLDPKVDAHGLQSYLTSQDLGPANSVLVNEIARAEADLKSLALQGIVNDQSGSLIQLRNQMIHEGYGMKPVGQETLSEQVVELKALQQALIDNHELAPLANQITKHRIFIKYAKEANFAQNHAEKLPSEVRALDYVSVNGRASWSPPTEDLSSACASGDLGTRVAKAGFGLVEGNVLNECDNLKAGRIKDHPIATGAFPPKAMKVFHQDKASQDAANSHTEKQNLYNHLRDMILNCDKGPDGAPTFDTAAKFLNDFDRTVMTNEITPADQARLKAEYTKAVDFLDPVRGNDQTRGQDADPTHPSIQDDLAVHLQNLGANPNQIKGLNPLYASLFSP
jgi:hypothetical protein